MPLAPNVHQTCRASAPDGFPGSTHYFRYMGHAVLLGELCRRKHWLPRRILKIVPEGQGRAKLLF